MKKTIFLLTVLLISFLAYISYEPKAAVASTTLRTIKQMTRNDVPDTLGNWQSISRDGRKIVFDRRPPPDWGPDGYGVYWDVYAMSVHDEPGQERPMTVTFGHDAEGAISGDGSRVVFSSDRFNPGEPWDNEIFTIGFMRRLDKKCMPATVAPIWTIALP